MIAPGQDGDVSVVSSAIVPFGASKLLVVLVAGLESVVRMQSDDIQM